MMASRGRFGLLMTSILSALSSTGFATLNSGDAPARSNTVDDWSTPRGVLEIRSRSDDERKRLSEQLLVSYPATITRGRIGGVPVDIIEPRSGVRASNRQRILINLHGGGFVFGARYEGYVASLPITARMGIKIVTVDYRMGPEYHFPAASEDVAKVYAALLRRYSAKNIGIFGCSAGAMLTAESVAWFQKHNLPKPGAIVLDSGGATASVWGDSAKQEADYAQYRQYPRGAPFFQYYFDKPDRKDPLESPAFHPEVLAKFPPTLVVSGTRDPFLSSSVFTHEQLVRAGVPAELHVFDGVGHAFTYDAGTPAAQEAYRIMAQFFNRHLGR